MDIQELKKRKRDNEAVMIGAKCSCPCCGKKFSKTSRLHVFCSNGRTQKKGNCKDRYWNLVRAGNFKTEVEKDEEYGYDPSWDSHKNEF